jgi:hypothetical protein
MKTRYIFTCLLLASGIAKAQTNFSTDPLSAVFETKDTDRFWKAFDKMGASKENPFTDYINNGSQGVKGFMEYRIINADSLYTMVKKRKEDYLKSRHILAGINQKGRRIRAVYSALKYWYPQAKFPPIYFVYGRFNTGGTFSKDGIMIGTETLQNLDGIAGLVSHETIHFQQDIKGTDNLLKYTLSEGSADFLSELVSGETNNSPFYKYGEANADKLYKEFVTVLKKNDPTDWLYGTSKKDDRPNDLGYWMGYKISEAYFLKQSDKHKAIYNILNIQNPLLFLKDSGFLDRYIREYVKQNNSSFEDFFKE